MKNKMQNSKYAYAGSSLDDGDLYNDIIDCFDSSDEEDYELYGEDYLYDEEYDEYLDNGYIGNGGKFEDYDEDYDYDEEDSLDDY